jgi:alpha-galactosidase
MNQAIAMELDTLLDKDGLPSSSAWEKAQPAIFCSDWRGQNPEPQLETRARLLWSQEYVFVQFLCRYRELYVYEECNCRRDELWDRDVAEIFIRPPEDKLRHYREFEISPNGNWLDLDIDHGTKRILFCDLKSRVTVNVDKRVWIAEMALPIPCLTTSFDPRDIWRLNLFRIEGCEPNRFYSAWQPTNTPKANFHVPEVFGELHFNTR